MLGLGQSPAHVSDEQAGLQWRPDVVSADSRRSVRASKNKAHGGQCDGGSEERNNAATDSSASAALKNKAVALGSVCSGSPKSAKRKDNINISASPF